MSGTYEGDFYAWTMEQAALLRAGRLSEADVAHIAEEIESMGRSERNELVNRLAILLLHLLNWQHQPSLRGNSWRLSVKEQRRAVARHLRQNPSLKARIAGIIDDAYGDAAIRAERETGLPEDVFPPDCPWPFDRIMDDAFWPE
ncbi:DUF29 domain-containing protein [Azospirillum halopraeferens]|uniref:DUF29 domain-containing protein n=1 Tax=Azospirillum halopraeferens TaxID=34010 RepID=UPI00042309C8|nr:DUF29 domain-containing protein [Azospirillum halopraeferens]